MALVVKPSPFIGRATGYGKRGSISGEFFIRKASAVQLYVKPAQQQTIRI